jgi:arsenate reductase
MRARSFPVSERAFNVLFLCTGNSARSIMAECALNHWGAGRIRAFSAGSHPTGTPHPLAVELMRELGYDVSRLRSKSWDEFTGPDAPAVDLVVTVCGNARDETCPVWIGGPVQAHWGVEDPAAVEGSEDERRRVFREIYERLERRIRSFVALPVESLDAEKLKREVDRIGAASD